MTNREKYDAFRKLYTGSDPHREDHRRFDKLVRLLLDLPESDEAEIKVGDFVLAGQDHMTRVIGRVIGVAGRWVSMHDADGKMFQEQRHLVELIHAFNEDIPF